MSEKTWNINLDGWQDYRGNHAGVVMYVETSYQAIVPVRDEFNENGKGSIHEPHYETSTFNFMNCQNGKQIASILRNKHRYILFTTRYNGIEESCKNKFLIIGYMRIDKTMDARKRHVHKYMSEEGIAEPECMTEDHCMACFSEDMKFYNPLDCFDLNVEVMQRWGYKGRVSRQMKLLLEGEKLDEILNHFSTKAPANAEYIETIREFRDALEEEEADEAEANW
jgi:hypothetical protein